MTTQKLPFLAQCYKVPRPKDLNRPWSLTGKLQVCKLWKSSSDETSWLLPIRLTPEGSGEFRQWKQGRELKARLKSQPPTKLLLPARLALQSFFSNLCKCPEKGNEIFISLCTAQLFLGFFCWGKMPLRAEQQDDVFAEASRRLQEGCNRYTEKLVLKLQPLQKFETATWVGIMPTAAPWRRKSHVSSHSCAK